MNEEEKIDIVLPYLHSKKTNGAELKYTLRSIEKHLSGYGTLYIMGSPPVWLKNTLKIEVKDQPYTRRKEFNIFTKIKKACEHPNISDNFLFMNDDHFLMKDFHAPTFPYYHKGSLTDTMNRNKGDYRKTIVNARGFLRKKELPETDFDTHCPIIYNKTKFLESMKGMDWSLDYGYAIKSLYCGLNGIEGEYYGDCKISNATYPETKARVDGKEFFSTGTLTEGMIQLLEELYPNKSNYEK